MDDRTLRTAIAAADGDDPYRALRELRRARVELNLALDRAEAVAVRRARAGGSSWQLIGSPSIREQGDRRDGDRR